METSAIFRIACYCLFLQTIFAAPKCNQLQEKSKDQKPFPNIDNLAIESFQMNVEYTVPGGSQTDYFVEYFDLAERQGKVEAHQAGVKSTFQYKTENFEGWEITDTSCEFRYANSTPNMMQDYQTEWEYLPDDPSQTTFGPSSMFRNAWDTWNRSSENMAYMGNFEGNVRGLKAQYWRRCDGENTYIDYFFSTKDDDGPYDVPSTKVVPLRVIFSGERDSSKLSAQQYEIMNFQPYITEGSSLFDLPKGKGCKRAESDDFPDLPDFIDKNIMFSAEVIYKKIDRTGDDAQYTSYYSTLTMALDLQSQHLAYYFTPWDTTKTDDDDIGDPEYIIYDIKNKYVYETKLEDGSCQIIRDKTFQPVYALPENGGSIYLDDPSILFPNNELIFLSEGTNRGLKVNIFEEVVEGYLISKKGELASIDKAIITHSYLQDNEIERNFVSVKNALVQVELLFMRKKDTKVFEKITLNFYGFSTEIRNRRGMFNIKRCFKNDDDYLWATIGFNADPAQIAKVKEDIPSIQRNILDTIQLKSELNPVRIPIILVDINDGIFVTMMILNKPPLQLDFDDVMEGKKIKSKEVEGISSFYDCATKCLEEEDNCWGISMCDAVCTFGVGNAEIQSEAGCQAYKRMDNVTFIPSMEKMAESIRAEVASNDVHLMLMDKDDNMVQLDATSFEVMVPGEDDTMFDQLGNKLNPRMRVFKVGYKLKAIGGTPVTNLGKIRYDECQRLCLDFKTCETVSYCLRDSQCVLSEKFGDEIAADTMEADNMCNIVTRQYTDNFERSPGNVLVETAEEVLDLKSSEECAKACLKSTKFKCLSFDHCPLDESGGCKLHTVHYADKNTREAKQQKSSNCGHYYRKFSTEFNRYPEKTSVGAKVPPVSNVTLEQCAKDCFEYGKGTCYGFDFCQGSALLATSCQLLDTVDYKTTYSPICENYRRSATGLAEPRPYSNGYAGGIGFLCFLIGLLIGAAVVFTIAYFRVNRQ